MFPPSSPLTAGKVSDGDDEDEDATPEEQARRRAIKAVRTSVSLSPASAQQIKRLGVRPPNDFSMDEKKDMREGGTQCLRLDLTV